jgi:hypothetical protein
MHNICRAGRRKQIKSFRIKTLNIVVTHVWERSRARRVVKRGELNQNHFAKYKATRRSMRRRRTLFVMKHCKKPVKNREETKFSELK